MTLPIFVSVVIATHNRPDMLETAIYSILTSASIVPETVGVLVVDDASETDDAERVADRCQVGYVRNDRNMGVGASLARGYAETDSAYSMFWGDDDVMLPRFLPLHLAKIREGHDAVYSSYFMADHNLRMGREMRLPLVTHRDLLRGQCNATDQSLIRRSAIESVGGWRPERERAMLMTMWLALTNAGKDIATIREATWLYRRHDAQLSHTKPNEHDMALRLAAIAEYR